MVGLLGSIIINLKKQWAFLQVRAGGWGRSMLCSDLLIFLGVHWGPTSPERLFQTRTRFLYGIELTFFKWDPPAFLKSGGTPLKKIRLVHRDPTTGTPLILVGPEAPTLSRDRRPSMTRAC